jgi:hypothetical protein
VSSNPSITQKREERGEKKGRGEKGRHRKKELWRVLPKYRCRN